MLSNCLLQLSCNQEEFEKAAPDYQEVMLKSGFVSELRVCEDKRLCQKIKERKHRVI